MIAGRAACSPSTAKAGLSPVARRWVFMVRIVQRKYMGTYVGSTPTTHLQLCVECWIGLHFANISLTYFVGAIGHMV